MNLSKIFNISDENLTEYKLHLASWNGYDQPLDLYKADFEKWAKWQRYRGAKNQFSRKYIFSFMQFYPDGNRTWLFGGIFEVLGCKEGQYDYLYEVELCEEGQEFIGRLKAKLSRPKPMGTAFCLENFWQDFSLSEILPEPYSGEDFPGYENISLDFSALETIYKKNRPDWKAALQNVKGIYCITDKKNGKHYIGSAYGDTGIWSRWGQYIETGHGGNKNLRELSLNEAGEQVSEQSMDYARDNFHFALLEAFPFKIMDDAVIKRENFWKEALRTRGEHGYNAN